MEVAGTPNKQAVEPRDRLGTTFVAPAFRGVMKAGACVTLLYCIAAAPAMALGFGEITRHSALGQPFLADVKLIGVNNDADLRCFKANLTSLDGDRLGTVTFNVNDSDGNARLYVGTREPVGEPAVQLSVEYGCAMQTKRDYQILLDPETITSSLVVNPPVVAPGIVTPASGPQTGPLMAPPPAVDAGAASKKSRRHHADAAVAAAPASSEVAPAPTQASNLKPSSALERKRARRAAKEFRSVLHLGDDATIDDNLNGVDSLHLSMSHGLHGENGDLDTKNPPSGTATQGAPDAAAAGTPAANATSATDVALKELQTKITKLEAQTEELKRLNAKQMADLEAARKEKESQGNQLYLYFLLLACLVAIAWLIWRSRQIQVGINHSWEDVLPGDAVQDNAPKSRYHTSMDDDFLDEPVKPKQAPRQEPKPAAHALDVDLSDLDAASPAPAPAPRKDDFMATLAMQRPGEAENTEGDYKFQGNARQSLPDAEEILDEIQQAEFWMDMQQPQRAIEILESNWGTERPSSPLPWLYLFDLYRMVGDQDKYTELTERFEHIFNGKVIPWEEKELLQHQRNLEDFPVLLKKITQLWTSEDIVPFMENLLIDDRDGRRQGFDLTAYRDILFLANIAYEIRESEGPAVAHEIDAPDWSVLNH